MTTLLDTPLTNSNLWVLSDKEIEAYVTVCAPGVSTLRVIEKMSVRLALEVQTYRGWIERAIAEVKYEDACNEVDLTNKWGRLR